MLSLAHPWVAHELESGRIGHAKLAKQDRARDFFSSLPDDLLSSIIGLLDVKGLLSLQICDKRLQRLAGSEKLWRGVFMGRFGLPSKIHETAHQLAGSWQALYKSKVVTDEAAGQWRKPCPYELQAALRTMIQGTNNSSNSSSNNTPASTTAAATATAATALDASDVDAATGAAATAALGGSNAAAGGLGAVVSEGGDSPARQYSSSSDGDAGSSSLSSSGSIDSVLLNNSEGQQQQGSSSTKTQLAVIFMLDSSGSVGDEDFTCMTDFLDTAAQTVAGVDRCKVCVVQFSNDTRVEVPLGPLDKDSFDAALKSMVRLNGGTNIAAAVAKAGALLKADETSSSSDMRRVLVLLTDGRIDGFQAREAAAMVARLSDEQSNVALWAFGVGRGVDSAELMRIIEGPGGASKGLGRERYMDLCVRDDAPW